MACTTLSDILKDCTTNLGGLHELHVNKLSELTAITVVGHEVTAATSASLFKKIDITNTQAQYTVTHDIDELGVEEFTHSINISIPKRRPTIHDAIKKMTEGQPDLLALVKDGNGQWWLLGYNSGLNVKRGSGGSGASKSDGTTYTYTIEGVQPMFELAVSNAIVATLLP